MVKITPAVGRARLTESPARKAIPPAPAFPTPIKPKAMPANRPTPTAAPARLPGTTSAAKILKPESAGAGRRMPKLSMIAMAGAVVLTIGVVCVTLEMRTVPAEPVVTPTAAPARVCAAAQGLVEAESGLLRLSFDATGKIRAEYFVEGQSVSQGQLLAELENDDTQARLQQAKTALKQSQNDAQALEKELDGEFQRSLHDINRYQAELALLKAGARAEDIARAKADALAAEADSKRMAEDAQKYSDPDGIKNGAWSAQLRDTTRRLAEAARARSDAAREIVNALENGSRKEDVARAEAILGSAIAEKDRINSTRTFRIQSAREQVAQAQAKVSECEALLEKTKLRAPIAGKVVWKYKNIGETMNGITPEPILALANCANLRVRAEIDEADLSSIKVGQRARLTADSCPGQTFHGKVTQIGASAGQKKFSTGETKEKMDVNVIETLVQIENPGDLKLGTRVTAYFESTPSK